MRRRDFLTDLARLSVLCAGVPNVWRVAWRAQLADDPFTLGVASGDPTSTSAVIFACSIGKGWSSRRVRSIRTGE